MQIAYLNSYGNRYGSIIDTGKSITNTEFLTARAKGIPIFVFIDKKTLRALDFWKENKQANFEKFVDITKIFEFISQIRDDGKLWTFEFEKAQDITSILNYQLSYLFKESLNTYSKHNQSLTKELIDIGVSNEALNIILQKNPLYEYEFFSIVLCDEMEKVKEYKNDLNYRIHYEPLYFIFDNLEVLTWLQVRFSTIEKLVNSLSNIINVALIDLLNESGKPADLKGLVYVAKAYAKLFTAIVRWTIDTRNANIPEDCIELKEKLSLFTKNIINDIWAFPKIVRTRTQEAKNELLLGGEDVEIILSLNLNIGSDDINNYLEEFERFKQYFYIK